MINNPNMLHTASLLQRLVKKAKKVHFLPIVSHVIRSLQLGLQTVNKVASLGLKDGQTTGKVEAIRMRRVLPPHYGLGRGFTTSNK